jgi:hypothetical protein
MSTEERPTTADLVQSESDDREELDDDLRDRAQEAGRDGSRAGEQERLEPLLADDRSQHYRERWKELQPRFVDEPRETVKEADTLVAELMQDLAASFSDARSSLEEQWSRGEDVSTEDLRVALQRYRSFFERLLAA